jgi:hypothetical protein
MGTQWVKCDIRNKEVLHLYVCTEQSTVLCPSVSGASNCSSQVLLHRSWAPAKKAIPRDRRDAVKQSKNASQMRQCSSLGDWNAGKEDDSLPGPNFGVPRDLFKGTTRVKTRQVVHWLCNNISRCEYLGTDVRGMGRTMPAQG